VLTKELGVEGVVLLKVEPGSAADAAGLRGTRIDRDGDVIAGDVIIALDGQAVDSVATLLARLEDHQIGDGVTLRIWRAGRELDVEVFLQGGN
jgi:S1-C subfamily serine protease